MEPNVKYLKTLGFKIGTKEKIQFHWCDGFLNYMTVLGGQNSLLHRITLYKPIFQVDIFCLL